jgi:hypothetical protein
MIEASVLAASAVGALAPCLVDEDGKEAAGAGLRLLEWLRGKLTGGEGAGALEEVAKAPGDAAAQAALRVQITKLLEREPELAGELGRLVWDVQNEEEARRSSDRASPASQRISGSAK